MSELEDELKGVLLLAIHDLSMSHDPQDAAMGRALKALSPAFDVFIETEAARGTPAHLAVAGLARAMAYLMTSAIHPYSPFGFPDTSKAAEIIIDMFELNMRASPRCEGGKPRV